MRHVTTGAIRGHCLSIKACVLGSIRVKNRFGFRFGHEHLPTVLEYRTIREGLQQGRATVLGRVKRWVLAMLAREERAARGSAPAA
jgi:hypothetical protein